MTPLLIAIGFIVVFGVGAAAGVATTRARYRSASHYNKALEAAREQGRQEAREATPLSPPSRKELGRGF